MSSKSPRLCVVLDQELYERIKLLAKIKNTSMSSMVCELIREALDLEEDLLLAEHLKQRDHQKDSQETSKEKEEEEPSEEIWEKKHTR